MPQSPFAILHFPDAPPCLYANPGEVLTAHTLGDVRPLLNAADAAARRGAYAVGFVTYEAAPAFDPALTVRSETALPPPLAWFAVFDAAEAIRLEPSPPPPSSVATVWNPDVSREAYTAAIEQIRRGIGHGDFYQVNHTFRLRARGLDPEWLWQRLRTSQLGSYAAYVDIGTHVIASASPELFFARDGQSIVTRPMKGTSSRGRWAEEDDANARQLASSDKERGENLMIVDLLRNDLGRVAQIGSVRVTELCSVERWPTILQMTSTIEASLRPETTTFDIFRALFPCGSVTGAPKVAATRAISVLEASPRGIYCGAIGFLGPNQRSRFNVAIRTATIDRRNATVEYGVGGGITWDSSAESEYDEAMLKARILTAMPPAAGFGLIETPGLGLIETPGLGLIETMRLENGEYVRLERHLARVAGSALYFGFGDPRLIPSVHLALDDFNRPGRWRVRLVIYRGGGFSITLTPLATFSTKPVRKTVAPRSVSSADPLLFHKTTHREIYDRHADALLCNERDELTEFATGNLVVEIDGVKWTPPRECGLLNGVFREELLERSEIRERVLRCEDLSHASRIWSINSLREWMSVAVSRVPPA